MTWIWAAAAAGIGAWLAFRLVERLRLSKAKHPSLTGHSRMAKRLARLVPAYGFTDADFFRSDGAPDAVAAQRRAAFHRVADTLRTRMPRTLAATEQLHDGVSDLQFVDTYRVPFQYSAYVREHLELASFAQATSGVTVTDLDGNSAYDVSGAYGVNVFGHDFYKECIDAGIERVRALGAMPGIYHPVVADNVRRLRAISGLDEVSFHMSGTEAVMQAVRLARYHTRRTHVVQFCGAYHGWWDGVQPGVGNPRPTRDVYTLKEMDEDTLQVLRRRHDIACVLVNPLQVLHPNASAPSDGTRVSSAGRLPASRDAYADWLRRLREVCTARGIVLIFDEVFLGFRIAYGGAQEYYGVAADMVTYGKTVGGGLPIGVLCGRRDLMKRFDDVRPADICFARGTFNTHPYVMGAMNVFLERIDTPAMRDAYAAADALWNGRAKALNDALAIAGLPVRVSNVVSVWTIRYLVPSRYNWMFQFYLRCAGLSLSWVGTGRLIFSHNYSDADFTVVSQRIVAAATAMQQEGWWWRDAGLTDNAIGRRILREMLAVRLPWLAPWLAPSALGAARPMTRPATLRKVH